MATDKERDQTPAFGIGVAARMVGLHAQTLRTYERLGLVTPQRPRGNRRLYSQEDVWRLYAIKELLDMGINLAGVEMILRMRERIDRMERALRVMEHELRRHEYGEEPRLLAGYTQAEEKQDYDEAR